MSSMLFKPIIRVPLISTDEYRDDTLMIGSPMVFHTAPPHPASKARITWSPVLVGGADASQNGFGDLIPAKLTLKSATSYLQIGRDSRRRALSFGDGVHYFLPAAHAIAAGEIARI